MTSVESVLTPLQVSLTRFWKLAVKSSSPRRSTSYPIRGSQTDAHQADACCNANSICAARLWVSGAVSASGNSGRTTRLASAPEPTRPTAATSESHRPNEPMSGS